MEPMTLGNSPTISPTPYLPAFLMGDPSASSPKRCTLSPIKRNLSFSQSAGISGSPDAKRANFGNNGMLGYHQTASPYNNYSFTPRPNQQNTSVSGPPTQGLFDSLYSEQKQVQSPLNTYGHDQSAQFGTSMTWTSYPANQSVNDSFLNASNFNLSVFNPPTRINSPEIVSPNVINEHSGSPNFWVTVFGFPPAATSLILSQFSECGTIIDKIFPPENGGNWVHLKFGSRMESCRALNYNERILGNNIMIGVTKCNNSDIQEKDKLYDPSPLPRGRPLAQVAFQSAQNDKAVIASPHTPQKSTGIVNKFMDTFFGW